MPHLASASRMFSKFGSLSNRSVMLFFWSQPALGVFRTGVPFGERATSGTLRRFERPACSSDLMQRLRRLRSAVMALLAPVLSPPPPSSRGVDDASSSAFDSTMSSKFPSSSRDQSLDLTFCTVIATATAFAMLGAAAVALIDAAGPNSAGRSQVVSCVSEL